MIIDLDIEGNMFGGYTDYFNDYNKPKDDKFDFIEYEGRIGSCTSSFELYKLMDELCNLYEKKKIVQLYQFEELCVIIKERFVSLSVVTLLPTFEVKNETE
jgi:hypothetical protein